MPDLAARLSDVVMTYGTRQALRGATLDVPQHEVTSLLGPNGAGKSTTIRLMAGLQRPTSGVVEVLGGAPGRPAARTRVNVMLQDDGLPTGAHGPEMVRHIARLRGAADTAQPLIERLDLARLGRTTIRRMSGGERRRVSLACALVGAPDVVVLDEPTAGLDVQGRRAVWDVVREMRDRGTTILLCTHLLDEAEALSDRVVVLDHGRCVASGTLAELTASDEAGVTFDGPLHLPLRGLLDALPEGFTAHESTPGTYRVTGPVNPQVLATITAWCAQHGVMPRNVSTGSSSLEDLFWKLTSSDDAP